METPKETFRRLLYGQIAPALEELHALCNLNNAPELVTALFGFAVEEERSIASLISDTLENHPVEFLK